MFFFLGFLVHRLAVLPVQRWLTAPRIDTADSGVFDTGLDTADTDDTQDTPILKTQIHKTHKIL